MNTKLLLTTLSACFLGWGLQSCTPFEEGAAIGAVAGGVIVHESHEHRHYNDCRHCYDNRRYDLQVSDVPSDDVRVAQKYNIPIEASHVIVSSIQKAENKDFSGMAEIGLQQDDLIAFYNNKDVSDEAIVRLSQKLGFEQDETRELVADMSADVLAEKALRNLK